MSSELQLDKSNWKPVIFGDVAQEVRQSTKDPVAEGIERVVGLEHIEPECIHLREWASIEEETTFTKTFRKGHVLFGRRRAYLKKAAQAEFDGICSGDITVMEAKEDLLPELLPFLVCNDKFFDYAVQHSAGGLSPRTKFKDIANYEFLLPPKDQQAKLAELLWAADAAIQSSLSLKEKLFVQLRATREHLIGMLYNQRHSLQDLCKKKISYGIVQPGPNIPDGKPFIQSSDLSDDGVDVASLGRTTPEIYEKYIRSEVEAGDILFSLRGNLGEVQFVPDSLPKSNLARGVARVSTNGKVNSSYLIEAIRCERIQRRIRALCTGSTFKEITIAELRGLKVPVPESLETQAEIAKTVVTVRQTYRAAQVKCSASKEITKSLINQIF